LPRALGAKVRILAQQANAIGFRPRVRHLRALRGNVGPERVTLFALGECETCKAAGRTEYRNSEEFFGHVPNLYC
jgi:hypothetical protein